MARKKKPKGKHRAYPKNNDPAPGSQVYVHRELTIPPSVNSIWIRGKYGSYKSRNYVNWEAENVTRFDRSCAYHLTKSVQIRVWVHPGKGWRFNRDIDNILKPVLDMLTLTNVIADDNSKIVEQVSIAMSTLSVTGEAYIEVDVAGFTSETTDGPVQVCSAKPKANPSRKASGNKKGQRQKRQSRGASLPDPA